MYNHDDDRHCRVVVRHPVRQHHLDQRQIRVDCPDGGITRCIGVRSMYRPEFLKFHPSAVFLWYQSTIRFPRYWCWYSSVGTTTHGPHFGGFDKMPDGGSRTLCAYHQLDLVNPKSDDERHHRVSDWLHTYLDGHVVESLHVEGKQIPPWCIDLVLLANECTAQMEMTKVWTIRHFDLRQVAEWFPYGSGGLVPYARETWIKRMRVEWNVSRWLWATTFQQNDNNNNHMLLTLHEAWPHQSPLSLN